MGLKAFWAAGLALALVVSGAGESRANPIEQACLASERGAARALCACIGDVAALTLSVRQMREGAAWFDDPQRAQDVRQSNRAADEAMWQAWRVFAAAAEQRCRG